MKTINTIMQYRIVLTALVLFASLTSCSSDKIKEKINQTGDVAGQAIGEFSAGVSNGVEKAIEPSVTLGDGLESSGIAFGKVIVASDSSASDNILTVYLIFNQDFKGVLTAKAFDSKQREMGRVKLNVEGKKDEAKYVDFHFDLRTNIDNNSLLTIE
jgi:hypothetical protein